MEFIKLNDGWNAAPNAPEPIVKAIGTNLLLSFYLNHFLYEGFQNDDIGILTFHNCVQYRLGSPNDEGFFIYNGDRYKKHGVEWGEFYLINDSDWEMDTEPDCTMCTFEFSDFDDLQHYLFISGITLLNVLQNSSSFL